MIYTVTFNPSLDYIVRMDHFEAGAINRVSYEQVLAGGKGINVSIVLHNLGHESTALGFVAGFTGAEIEHKLDAFPVKHDFVHLENGFSRINVKAKAENETEINGQGPDISEAAQKKLFEKLARNAKADRRPLVVVGRDARISGEMVRSIVCGTLLGMGFDVVDLGLATTPTTELAVRHHNADGGIIITASHNPTQWNALKLLNSEGEFLTAADGAEVLDIAAREDFVYADVDNLGSYTTDNDFDSCHIKGVLDLELVDVEAVKERKFRVCIDAINSVGG